MMDKLNRRAVLQKTLTFGAAFLAGPLRAQTKNSDVVPTPDQLVGTGEPGNSRTDHDYSFLSALGAGGRPGGHVRTSHDPFADGLYADIGAEHF
jgi:hypothetical protein